MRLYSNPSAPPLSLVELQRKALAQRQPERPLPVSAQRVERRLGNEFIERIVAEYALGTSTTRLAKSYGIGKGTLLRLIRESGVSIRRKGPSGSSPAASSKD